MVGFVERFLMARANGEMGGGQESRRDHHYQAIRGDKSPQRQYRDAVATTSLYFR